MVIELSTSPDILKLPAKLGFFSFASCGRVLKTLFTSFVPVIINKNNTFASNWLMFCKKMWFIVYPC